MRTPTHSHTLGRLQCCQLQVNCGVRGKLDPPCNAVGYIDREVLGINHMYAHPAWKRSKVRTCSSLDLLFIELFGLKISSILACHLFSHLS